MKAQLLRDAPALIERCRNQNIGFKAGKPVINVALAMPKPIQFSVSSAKRIVLNMDGESYDLTIEQARDLKEAIVISLDEAIRPPTIIRHIVAVYYGTTTNNLDSDKRTNRIIWPRWVAMHFIRHLLKDSLADIGAMFGGFDHGTVFHGLERVRERMELEPEFKTEMETIEGKIREALEVK